jgi:hypothetical protein
MPANPFSAARVAKVVRVMPEAHACDLIYLDDLSRAPLVQIMAGVSTDTGHVDLPEPAAPSDEEAPHRATKDRDLYAVVMPVGGIPLVWGFLPPQVSQLLFRGRKNFRVSRHGSDVYSTLEDDGSFTFAWPNGTYMKVGAAPAKEDLTGKDFDAKWEIKRNRAVAPHVHLSVADGEGAETAVIDIAPSGAITSSAPSWTHTGPFHATGDITSDGTVHGAVDVIADDISGKSHTHAVKNVQSGSATKESDPPT